jgi:hypothetical protein
MPYTSVEEVERFIIGALRRNLTDAKQVGL